MHASSYNKMEGFRQRHLAGRESESLHICDLGSQDINGSYRPLFSEPAWQYLGLDMASGNNVDIVLTTPYAWPEVASGSIDVMISGQAFEHIQYFWITILEIARVLKPGGICCIIAPSSGPEHRYPMDCWRFYPDGMTSLAQFAQLEVIEVATEWEDKEYVDGSGYWHDSILVCHKLDNGFWGNFKANLTRWFQHRTLTTGMR